MLNTSRTDGFGLVIDDMISGYPTHEVWLQLPAHGRAEVATGLEICTVGRPA
jgi:hypothetical protein